MTVANPKPARPANLHDFGAIGDNLPSSTATNSAALNKFGVWARTESAAGRAVAVVAPPGVYYFDAIAAADCFKGISKLVFSGHGATFLQTRPEAFPWPNSCDTLLYRNPANPRIAVARKGDTRVTALTPPELAHFSVGEMVMIAGLDIQFGGYPPNLYCFDFVRIDAIDPRTGTVTFDPPLAYDYLPTYASYGARDLWAGSRIYKLDRNGFTWNIDHTFLGLTCRHAAEARSQYISAMGRTLTFRDCDVPGFAESICEDFLAERCVERLHTEPDKLVKRSVRRNGDLRAGLGIQSGSIDQILAENCKITLLGIGGKKLTVRNCDIDKIGYGGLLGFCDTAIFEDCRIAAAPYFYPYQPGARFNYVDGVNVTYTNGVFTILKNDRSGLANGGGLSNWNVVPGQALQFCRGAHGDATAGGSYIASDIGTGLVLSMEDRPNAVAITTTLKAASVPAWSSGQVSIRRRNPPIFRNCTGAEPVRLGTEADKAGKNFGEYFEYLFTAKNIVQGAAMPGRTGKLVRVYANVIKPMAAPGAKLTLGEQAAYVASSMTSPRHYQIDIDLTIAGKRDFTIAALRGAVGKDLVSYGNQPQAHLPADVWCQDGMPLLFCSGAPFLSNAAAAPIVELIFEFDLGLLGRHITLRPNGRAA